MSRKSIRLKIDYADSPHELVLELDPEKFTQRWMLEALKQGQMYEQETIRVLSWMLHPGDTFVDIGGHVGFVSMFAAGRVGPSGRVFTFEPERSNYEHLLRHIELNHFRHVFPLPWAVGERTSTVELFFNPDNDGGHALWDPGLHPFNQKARSQVTKLPVFRVSLDDVFRDAGPGHTKLIKIDTEGNEVNVLRGAQRFLHAAEVPGVIVEVNPFGLAQLGSSEQEMRSLMAQLGFVPFLLTGQFLQPLGAEEYLQNDTVSNLLFARPELAQTIQQKASANR